MCHWRETSLDAQTAIVPGKPVSESVLTGSSCFVHQKISNLWLFEDVRVAAALKLSETAPRLELYARADYAGYRFSVIPNLVWNEPGYSVMLRLGGENWLLGNFGAQLRVTDRVLALYAAEYDIAKGGGKANLLLDSEGRIALGATCRIRRNLQAKVSVVFPDVTQTKSQRSFGLEITFGEANRPQVQEAAPGAESR
jgi:hypothetical protein